MLHPPYPANHHHSSFDELALLSAPPDLLAAGATEQRKQFEQLVGHDDAVAVERGSREVPSPGLPMSHLSMIRHCMVHQRKTGIRAARDMERNTQRWGGKGTHQETGNGRAGLRDGPLGGSK